MSIKADTANFLFCSMAGAEVAQQAGVSPAHVWEASALLIPVCELAVPVDSPGSDAQIPFPGDLGVGVGKVTPPHGVNHSSLLW